MPGAGGEVAAAEPVDEDEHRGSRGPEPATLTRKRPHELWHDTGEAPGAGRVRG